MPGGGDDIVKGGSGIRDGIGYYDAPSGVVVDLTAGTASGFGNDTLAGISNVWGTAHDDTIIGNGDDNDLRGPPETTSSEASAATTRYGVVSAPNVLNGGNGDDELYAGRGKSNRLRDNGTPHPEGEVSGKYDISSSAWYGNDYLNGGEGTDNPLGGELATTTSTAATAPTPSTAAPATTNVSG